MIRWSSYPFARPTLAVMLGISAYEALLRPAGLPGWTLLLTLVLVAAGWAGILWRLPATQTLYKLVAGTGLLLTFAVAAAGWTHLSTASVQPTHLLHQPPGLRAWQGVVVEGPTRRPTYAATTAEVERVRWADGSWHPAVGRVRLLVRAEAAPPTYGDVLLVSGTPRRVAPPPNPGQFDYARYLRIHQTWHEQYAGAVDFQVYGHRTLNPLKGLSLRTADYLRGHLARRICAPRERGLLTALVLGITDDLGADLKAAYGTTGTTHVLAVSGLHIALLFGVVLFFLGRHTWHRRSPAARWATLALILALGWSYALLTGLSASVLRAVVMSSLVVVGRALNKRVSLYNTLAVAAFTLLALDPYALFDAGFQLSFLAVLGIAYLQSQLARWWQPRTRAGVFVRDGLSVTIAAQLATTPLTLYYFHQFPVHFLGANLVAVPWTDVLLGGSLLLLLLSAISQALHQPVWLETLADGLAWLVEHGTWALNGFIGWVGHLPGALATGIALTPLQLALAYLGLLLALLWLHNRQRGYLLAVVGVIALYAGTRLATHDRYGRDRTLLVYAIRHHRALGLLDGFRATLLTDSVVWADSTAGALGQRANLLPSLWARGTQQQRWLPVLTTTAATALTTSIFAIRPLPDSNRLLALGGVRLLVLDHDFGLQPTDSAAGPLSVDYVLVGGKPRVVPSALARAVACRWVVFDGSGPAGWVKWQARQLRAAGFRCHDVAQQGAFIRRLSE